MHLPCILSLILASNNLSGQIDKHTSDRVVVSIAFAIVIECLVRLSLSYLAWGLVIPGILLLILLEGYRAFLGVKEIQTTSSTPDLLSSFSSSGLM